MLLKNLVSIVTTTTQKTQTEVLEIIDSFINDFGFSKFNDDVSFPFFNEVIESFKQNNLIREYYTYTCLKYDETENTSTMMTECLYCGKKINVVNGEHEIRIIYQISKEKGAKLLLELKSMKEKQLLERYLIEDFQFNLEQLVKRKTSLIPFMGSGLSVPFNLPDWKDMLKNFSGFLKKGYEGYYNDKVYEGDFFEALSYLKKSSLLTEDHQLQEMIVEMFEEKINMDVEGEHHAYLDILNLQSDFYLTTNYDNIFSEFRKGFLPPLKWDEIENMQKFLDKKQQFIIHLHGMIHKPKSMIVTKESYDKLYQDVDYMRTLSTFMSSKSFLFIGFSFQDVYFKDLYNKIVSKILGEHFIILPNISFSQAQELSKQNLKVIGISVEKDSDGRINNHDMVTGIKTIINYIKDN